MKGKILTNNQIAAFAAYLKSEEKSENTIEKYIRDVRAFIAYMGNTGITQEAVIAYTIAAIATDSHATESAVKMTLSRTRGELKAFLEKEGIAL